MEFSYLHGLLTFLKQHPHIGGLITAIIAFAESLPIVGAIIPGSVTMTAIGALIGSGVMPLVSTLMWAIIGALIGDFLSYWVGAHYNERLRQMWPFRRYPKWLELGEAFFRQHGGKSVIIGRFFGPVRSAVPLVAGLMHMPRGRFLLAAIPSAILWSLVYIIPGIIVGALSLELAPAAATKFILIILILIAFSWVIVLLLHMFLKKLLTYLDRVIYKWWQFLITHKQTHWFTTLLCAPACLQKPNATYPSHRQLALLLATAVCLLLFGWIGVSVICHVGIYRLNWPLFELLRSLRTHRLDNLMLAFTLLGEKQVALSAAGIIAIGLVVMRRFRAAFYWVALVVLAAGGGEILKHLYSSPRPPGLLSQSSGSSFPSGHTLFAVALFGFLAMLISLGLEEAKRNSVYSAAAFLSIMVALSRIFLGAHWLTDVLASIFLGLACICFIAIFYRRKPTAPPAAKPLIWLSILAFLLATTVYGVTHFAKLRNNYTLYWPTATLNSETWWTQHSEQIPLFLVSRLGKPHDVLNVQWLSPLAAIQDQLTQRGWQSYTASSLTFQSTWQRISPKHNPAHLPVLPTLYQNKTPALWLTKTIGPNQRLNLILWKSNISMQDKPDPLWVGSIAYAIPKGKTLPAEQKQQLYQQAIEQLSRDLAGFQTQIVMIPALQRPPLMEHLQWNGTLLLVRQP
ncbi:MAG: VTT domain-containing protein [Gammaproteobacteria bacterium]